MTSNLQYILGSVSCRSSSNCINYQLIQKRKSRWSRKREAKLISCVILQEEAIILQENNYSKKNVVMIAVDFIIFADAKVEIGMARRDI